MPNRYSKRLLVKLQDLIQIRISSRELECGILLAFNYPPYQIATILKLSRRTIDSYLNNLKLKCSCANKYDLKLFLQQKLGLELRSTFNILDTYLNYLGRSKHR